MLHHQKKLVFQTKWFGSYFQKFPDLGIVLQDCTMYKNYSFFVVDQSNRQELCVLPLLLSMSLTISGLCVHLLCKERIKLDWIFQNCFSRYTNKHSLREKGGRGRMFLRQIYKMSQCLFPSWSLSHVKEVLQKATYLTLLNRKFKTYFTP